MVDRSRVGERLERECRVFCRHLVGRAPSNYVRRKYAAYHANSAAALDVATDQFDRLLLRVAGISPLMANLVDSYTSRFHKRSVVRKKLVLLLAILECSPPSFEQIDAPDRGTRAWILAKLFGRGLLYGLTLLVSVVAFGAIHGITKLASTARVRKA